MYKVGDRVTYKKKGHIVEQTFTAGSDADSDDSEVLYKLQGIEKLIKKDSLDAFKICADVRSSHLRALELAIIP